MEIKNFTNKRCRHLVLLICFFSISMVAAQAQELPKPNHEHTFFMMPIYENIRYPSYSELDIRREMDKMISQLGEGNLYHQWGTSAIYVGYSMAERACRISKEKGMRLGIILRGQTHTNDAYFPMINQDIRGYQWRLNGRDWYYSAGQSNGTIMFPGELRDSGVYTPSRLCSAVRNRLMADIAKEGAEVARLMKEYPGVISVSNAIIEQELATGGEVNEDYLADYSPYAITEFRDWLRHKGIYDATTGTYKDEGAQAAIVGTYLMIDGKLRSQFYDDPTPGNANGTGESFNVFYGTDFTTWTNKYYDLVAYADPIVFPISNVVSDFDPTPSSGIGYTAGGFDAPRVRNVNNKFWNAWSYDVLDHGGAYPVGNPVNPAFGFRQQMVKNYIKDVFNAYADAGLPTESMYPHQIPGEAIHPNRLRSGADPIWTGHLKLSNNTGITKFGYIDPATVTQYSPSWGIFEWHPMPGAVPTDQNLYSTSFSNLNTYYQNNCHALFPGWWDYETIPNIFPLPDSKFAEAIRSFGSARKEQPYTRKDQTVPNYTPPQVQNVEVISIDAQTDMIRWSQEIWKEYPETWGMWTKTGTFEVEESTDNANWTQIANTYAFSAKADNRQPATTYYYRVRANTKTGSFTGPWSSVATSSAKGLSLTPDLATLPSGNPEIVNKIAIKITEPTGSVSSANSYATGGSFTRLDANTTKFTTEFTNNNQAENPADIKLLLVDGVAKAANDEVSLKFTPPTGAAIDAVTFNYFSSYSNGTVTLQILDDNNQMVWENDAFGLTSGYKGIHFPATSSSFTVRLKMKQSSSNSVNWFAQLSGIKVVYTTRQQKTAGLVTATVSGVGVALNTLPSNYAQATLVLPLEGSNEVSGSYMLENVRTENGVFSATTSGGNDPNVYFHLPQPLNGQANPYVYLRMYASQDIPDVQLFWFKPGAANTTFPVVKGWNVIKLSNISDYNTSTNISTLRLDFGSLTGAIIDIKVDWIVASPQPYSESLISLLALTNGEATMLTSPTGSVGTYRVDATYNGASGFADVNVGDGIDPTGPTDITLSMNSVLENQAAGIQVALLSSVSADPDAAYTYSLVAGAGSADNASFTIESNQLKTAAVFDFESKGSYSIRVRTTNANHQIFEKVFSITIGDVNEAPTFVAPANQDVCYVTEIQSLTVSGITAGPESAQSLTLSVSSTNADLFDQLSLGTVTNGTSLLSYRLKEGASGTAQITVTVSDNGGTDNGGVNTLGKTFMLNVIAPLSLSIVSSMPGTIRKGESIQLTASGAANYTWENAAGIINGQKGPVLTIQPAKTTTYTVTGSAGSCSSTQSVTITVVEDDDLQANNVLTPNGDGINDFLTISNMDRYPNNELKIFDRSGRIVYTAKGYNNQWDGTMNGIPLAEATYYYVIDLGTGKNIKKGFISIVRKK